MRYDFDSILDRKNTGSSKWDDMKGVFGRDDLIPLWKADTDFETSPIILDALKKRLEHPNLGYAAESSLYSVVELFKTKTNFNFKSEDIISCLGMMSILGMSLQAFSNVGDTVIIDSPPYNALVDIIENNNRKVLYNPLIYNNKTGEFTLDILELESKITPQTKIWLLCNPHNPTGKVFTKEELQKVEYIAKKYNIIIIADEMYHFSHFSNNRPYIPFASLSDDARNRTITAVTGSKVFGLAGLMFCLAIIPNEELRTTFFTEFTKAGLMFSKRNVLGLIATEAAYSKENMDWFEQQKEYVYGNALLVQEFFKTYLPKVIVTPPEGTFLVWLNFNGLNIDPSEIQNKMINEAKIAMNDGAAFGYPGFYRMNIGCSRQLLMQALENIKKIFIVYQ